MNIINQSAVAEAKRLFGNLDLPTLRDLCSRRIRVAPNNEDRRYFTDLLDGLNGNKGCRSFGPADEAAVPVHSWRTPSFGVRININL